jgi:hypothetical protein
VINEDSNAPKYKPQPNIGVGMPHWIYLNQFGKIVHDAFGNYPYLVGSAAVSKTWRDVDVRLILSDEEFERLVGKIEKIEALNPRWCAFNLAFAELGKRITGLPIDFQIQQRTQANREYPDGPRCPLILAAKFDEAGE